MTERWCSWHKPAAILLERVDDSRPEILRTHTICPDCLREMEKSEKAAPDLALVDEAGKRSAGCR
ncbi:hypothetical protein ES707_18572 [subsurface metagenome]